MTRRLSGKVAVVTGAASGIGQAIANGFLREGADVWFLDRTEPAMPSFDRDGVARAVMVDVTSEREVEAGLTAVREAGQRLDIVVHCAAVQGVGSDSQVADLERSVWDQTIEINLGGTFVVCKHALKVMLDVGNGGSIINCGSPTALRGSSADFAAYSSSKGGVHALTRVIATAYGRYGIRANTLIPGPTLTPLTAAAFDDPGVRNHLVAKIALGRLGEPEDYVGIATYLASDESRFTTGGEFVVDGGYTVT